MLRERIIAYAIVCAYVSALPLFALHVVLSGAARALRLRRGRIRGAALRAVGSILASLAVHASCGPGPQTFWPVGCGLAVATAIAFVPVVNHIVPIAFWLLVVGAGTAR